MVQIPKEIWFGFHSPTNADCEEKKALNKGEIITRKPKFRYKGGVESIFRVLACKDSGVSIVPYSNVYGHTMQMWQKWAGTV